MNSKKIDLNQLIEEKEKELTIIDKIITEDLIISQIKYLEYTDRQEKIKTEIAELKEKSENNNKKRKTWINLEGGWRKRINKNE